jgi:protein gp37
MGDRSAIEWTDATWNPTTGCTKVSEGCDNCYAHTLAHGRLSDVYLRQLPVINSEENRADPFSVRLWRERLKQPEKWTDPRRVFVNSMSDLFHAEIPNSYLREVFEVMLRVDHHNYQVLTKRPTRALRFFRLNHDLFPEGLIPPHIWIGTSVENQAVSYRVRQLRAVPAAVRFLSCEPLLGDLQLDLQEIHWVIVGGESGIGYRPMREEWVRSIQRQCEQQYVAFFFKQWGGRTPKAKGRMLDGRTWDEMPIRIGAGAV